MGDAEKFKLFHTLQVTYLLSFSFCFVEKEEKDKVMGDLWKLNSDSYFWINLLPDIQWCTSHMYILKTSQKKCPS